ncbi:uracil-DNA glycosylase-like protein [Apiosordaria backusii]|uniref:Uracil-DNA glycosylase-like protein n=1 Tax=Apiosordaria backusii TaxID=314023 RepID=A0AA40EYQ4_9PEZI|nr:uracil-DNA glycosylase-like protein [Apiosordaria backusii]
MSETSPPPEEATDNLPTPTFAGRLKLSEFMFTSDQNKTMPPQPLRKTQTPQTPPHTPGHLPSLPDALLPNLILLFVGLNPGILTSTSGHAYAHPTNLFWRLLHSSGITPRLCQPQEDRSLPAMFSLGLTNIVPRPTRNGAELSKQEMDAGVEVLEEKIRKYKPEAVCIVGKSIWESVWRVRHGRAIKKEEFRYGWQDRKEDMGVVFVACSTSGLAATLKPREKEEIWNELGGWVVKRRKEREEEKKGDGDGREGGGEVSGEVVDESVKQEQ